ncbi:prepilin-type N-terminal cleavage/methylation domain-containing protein [Cellulomonas sp. NS3]|uniref:prepilin-type N-terminal cleavage/methylation domain-containing protein n=1 Tax=Cellulomonas sp. NS3 TaxID=2973977 RepID=UPI002162FFC9|nr:prepilin-type N-terminal cleavage/methylation domain-containing protein [Cellulomonas sp. NS3]
MAAHVHRPRADEGFTLVELLVVIIIIGILAGIAVPVFLKQRQRAVDASLKSDLRSVANELETVYADEQAYPPASGVTSSGSDLVVAGAGTVRLSAGNTISYEVVGATGYCLFGTNPRSSSPSGAGFVYVSTDGGLRVEPASACP